MNSPNQQLLEQRIKEFVKKFYLNKLYKGIIFTIIITLATFIIFSLFEYYSYFNTIVRTFLFYSFLILCAITLCFYIIIPLFKIFGLGKQLSREEIARIIGKHFNQIDDKLLNLFELENQMRSGNYKSYDLLSAAIDSKINTFKTYSFVQAVPIKKTKKSIKWALIPIAIFLLLFSINSKLFTESTKRIVHYTQIYEKPAPYSFNITNPKLTAFQHDDFTVKFKIKGEEIPKEVYISYGNRSFKCNKLTNSEFSYTFTNMQHSTEFQLTTDEVQSSLYTVNVLPKPVTLGFVMELHYPAYINKPDEVIDNNGNASVPEGTKINWVFYTKNSDNLIFIANDKTNLISSTSDNFVVSTVARNNFTYSILNKNKYFTSKDTLTDEITVIKDLYPEIYVISQQDSMMPDRYYFKGNIKDDYGFSSLQFVYNKHDKDGKLVESYKTINIPIQSQVTIQDFYYYFDPNTFALEPGESIDYYFQVADNDGVNGHKVTKSSQSSFKVRTEEEVNKSLDKADQQTKSDFNQLLNESSKLLQDIDKMQVQMMQQKDLSWQDKKKLEQLLSQYKQLQQQINDLKQQQQNQQTLENQYKNVDPEIIKKQAELQKRMDQILSDEMKDMMQKLQDMMQSMNKDKITDQMQKMKNNTQDIKQSLDQQLQLYKQLEVEKKLNETVKQFHDLSLQQQQNASKTTNKSVDKEDIMKKQQDIQNQYNQLKQDLQELEQLNKALDDPNKLQSTQPLQQNIEQNLQQSMQNMQKNNRSKSSDNQNNAAQDMDKMAEQLQNDFNQSELESVSEDIQTLRQILDNLVKISFDQEDVMTSTQKANPRSAIFSDLMKKQHNVQDNMKIIEDSLNALAHRQTSVQPFIQTEVSKIQNYISDSQDALSNRQGSLAAKDQQYVLTSMNNLALMLNESLKDMQKKKSECKSKCNKSGNGSCSKPGGKGKSKKTSARELQQQLNRQMEAMKRSMEQQGKQGQTGQQQQMSEQFAKMAAQQEAIRKMVEDYQNQMKSQNGVGDQSLQKLIDDMKKTEKELVNRTLNQQTLQRQQSITTRLLESERADLEREKDDQRKATEATQQTRLNPPKNWNFDTQKTQQNEMLKSVPANLNYYYKEKANLYFYNIE